MFPAAKLHCRPSPIRRKSAVAVIEQRGKWGGQPSLRSKRAEISAIENKSKHQPASSLWRRAVGHRCRDASILKRTSASFELPALSVSDPDQFLSGSRGLIGDWGVAAATALPRLEMFLLNTQRS